MDVGQVVLVDQAAAVGAVGQLRLDHALDVLVAERDDVVAAVIGRGVRVGNGVQVGSGVRVGVSVGGKTLVGVTNTSGG